MSIYLLSIAKVGYFLLIDACLVVFFMNIPHFEQF